MAKGLVDHKDADFTETFSVVIGAVNFYFQKTRLA